MKNGLLRLSLIVGLVLSASCLWAQNSFKVEAPNVVGDGERFLVKFVANGEVSNFNPPSFAGADVIAGPTTSTSWSSTIINGKRSSSYTKTYTYVLEASDQGTVTVSSASADIEGTTYTTNPLSIEIVKGSSLQQTSSQTQTQQAQPQQQFQAQPAAPGAAQGRPPIADEYDRKFARVTVRHRCQNGHVFNGTAGQTACPTCGAPLPKGGYIQIYRMGKDTSVLPA